MIITPSGYQPSGYFSGNTQQTQEPNHSTGPAALTPVVSQNQENQSPNNNHNDKAPPSNKTSTNTTDQPDQSQDPNTARINGLGLTNAEIRLVKQLQQTDAEVRRHEMAHIAVGGRYITSGANFSYKRGPDGKNYAVGGEVGIDTSPIPGDPAATIQKMRQIKNSALAPANPSAQDRRVAAKASTLATQALSELMILNARQQARSNDKNAFGNLKNASDTYVSVSGLPEDDASSFQIAV